MSNSTEQTVDAITEDEIAGTSITSAQHTHEHPPKKPRNAFTELMSQKPKPQQPTTTTPSKHPLHQTSHTTHFHGRDGLGAYTDSPESFPSSRVLYYNADFVVINDLYPKASIHLLLLPRDRSRQLLHPFDALAEPTFRTSVLAEIPRLRKMVASGLRQKYGSRSRSEQARLKAMESDDPPEVLPPGRDWEKEVITGVHAHPSMNHLHIHVLSREAHNECMKHRRHYNSFHTPFLVPVEDLPLREGDERLHAGKFLDAELRCWRCGKGFGHRFASFKRHLEDEFEEWVKE